MIDADTGGDGTFDLISNDEWQTIARDIELVPSNWSENVVGGVSTGGGTDANELNHGHADNAPFEPLIANVDDNQGCDGTGQTCTGGALGDWNIEKRTHSLSNSEVIWDLGGNVWEWVKDDYINASVYGPGSYMSQVTAVSHTNVFSLSGGTTTTARNAKDQFSPLNDYISLSVGNNGGLGYGWLNYSAGAVVRGGNWGFNTNSGVFAADLGYVPGFSFLLIGFRCVWRP